LRQSPVLRHHVGDVASTEVAGDRVWVDIEVAVRAGLDDLDDKAVIDEPPKSDEDVMWLAATITDHVCATLPEDVYRAFRASLD
jgi:hypothetical protein